MLSREAQFGFSITSAIDPSLNFTFEGYDALADKLLNGFARGYFRPVMPAPESQNDVTTQASIVGQPAHQHQASATAPAPAGPPAEPPVPIDTARTEQLAREATMIEAARHNFEVNDGSAGSGKGDESAKADAPVRPGNHSGIGGGGGGGGGGNGG
eukprot:4316141-Pleurochrysis_carterae.AAC.1